MGKIKKILENELVGGTQTTDVYPVTSVKAVYDENNERLDHILNRRGVVNTSTNYNSDHIAEVLTLSQAIAKVPSSDRVLGFTMTLLTPDGWRTYQFTGDSISNWSDTNKWYSYVYSEYLLQETGNSKSLPMSQYAVGYDNTICNVGLNGDGNVFKDSTDWNNKKSPFLATGTGTYNYYEGAIGYFFVTPYIYCKGLKKLHFKGTKTSNTALAVQYDENFTVVNVVNGSSGTDEDINIVDNAVYIRFCGDIRGSVNITVVDSTFKTVFGGAIVNHEKFIKELQSNNSKLLESLNTEISERKEAFNLEHTLVCNTMLNGEGTEFYDNANWDNLKSPFLDTKGDYKYYPGVEGYFVVSPYIPIYGVKKLHYKGGAASNTSLYVIYDKDKKKLSNYVPDRNPIDIDIDIDIDNAVYIRFCGLVTNPYKLTVVDSVYREVTRKQLEYLITLAVNTSNSFTEFIGNYAPYKFIELPRLFHNGLNVDFYEKDETFDNHNTCFLDANGVYRYYPNIEGYFYVSYFIPVEGGTKIRYTGRAGQNVSAIVEYDKDKNIINNHAGSSDNPITDLTVTLQEDTKYVRFSGDIRYKPHFYLVDIYQPDYLNTIFNRIEDSIITLEKSENFPFLNEDNSIKTFTETNPIKIVSMDAGLTSIFHNWGFIGDSLSSGTNYTKEGASGRIFANYDYSWCQRIIAMIGQAKGSNWSVPGYTAKSWITQYWNNEQKAPYETTGADSYFKIDKKQIYTIFLGTNDAGTGVTLGDYDSDVDLSNFENNADTFIGNYVGIIQRIKSIAPSAKIFVLTCVPSSSAETGGYNDFIRSLPKKFTNVFLVDLAKYMPRGEKFDSDYIRMGHFSTQGYQHLANCIATYIDYIIRNNPDSFKFVQILNTEYDDGTY